MSTDRDTTRIVRSWLEEGATALPDRVLDAVLDQLPATSQRRAWWPAWRFREMNTPLRIAIAVAAVMVVAVVGFSLQPREGGIGRPGPSPSPTPTAASSPVLNFTGSFVPGTTYAIDDPCCVGSSRMTFTMPATGWSAGDFVVVGKNVPGGSDVLDVAFSPFLVGNVYTGGCHWRGTALTPRLGPTVDDLVTALSAQAGPGSSPPTAVTVGGHPGKKVELSIPEDLDVAATCDSEGDFRVFGRWTSADDPYAGSGPYPVAGPWTFGKGQHDTVYIVDVDGTRQVIDTMYVSGTSAADLAELDRIVASIGFEPRPSGPASSVSPAP